MAKNKRVSLSTEEKNLKTLQALFILNATQLQISKHDIRKILGVAMNDVTAITRAMGKGKGLKLKK